MRDYKQLEQKQVSEMNGQEIEELMFHAARGANDQLFFGLTKRFLLQFEEDIRSIHERLEQLERLVKMLIESKQEAKKEVNVEEWKTADKSFIEEWKPNPKLQEALEKVDKEKLAKAMEEAMKVNTLRAIPMTKVEVSEFKKGADEE
ncbi:hypothetical protein [Geobacillus sp. YHL]|uniref:hypothetical protein n=1 Tax=Geobacillus sp. YHL TaxID=2796117 RepID=UPI001EF0FDD2|nr:hypothetical protein [Geobacillus sp. YHL]MCG6793834.1 hypothetical protein [Geobacillus sp. YHL]